MEILENKVLTSFQKEMKSSHLTKSLKPYSISINSLYPSCTRCYYVEIKVGIWEVVDMIEI